MGCFTIRGLLSDKLWSTRYIIPKKDHYSISSRERTLGNLNFTIKNRAIELDYDEIDISVVNM